MNERGNSLLRKLDLYGGVSLTIPAFFYRRLSRKSESVTDSPRVGILCMGAIGDALLLSALAIGVRQQAPNAIIELLGTSANAGVLPLLPAIDSHYACPVTRPQQMIAHMRSQAYDILLDASQWARLGAVLCSLSGAGLTVGFKTARQYRALPYDMAIEHKNSRHEVDNFLELGRAVWPELRAAPGLKDIIWRNNQDNAVYCHMWPAAGKGRHLKQWPASHWAEFIAAMLAQGKRVALTGSIQDRIGNEAFIKKYFPDREGIKSLAGNVNLPDLARLFARAAVVVSVNTGIMHLAAIAGAPTIGLHGATNPRRWGPVGPRAVSLLPSKGQCAYLNLGFEYPADVKPAMQNISVNSVIEALDKLARIDA